MENKERLQEYHYDDYKVVTNFETYEDAVQYAAETGGEMVEIGFVDGSDNPLADDTAQLMNIKKPFRVGLDPEYTVYYSEDEGFQEMAQNILEEMKELEDDTLPEDWIDDQNIATGDRIIIVKDGEINTVTTRERIKYLMRGNLYEIAVKLPN
ncbi:hypothetical protein [Chryseobacterium lacus]|uniref:hypothetical protein n=1 Tax=Chryseobacterium lacus TaxID=2058346 RepID=UPI000F87A99C|nr:hypothetical protein [Chryseobacterium lacus]RST26770.1 hypothetical protein EIZ46_05855 [Chryseobacterium lacus]